MSEDVKSVFHMRRKPRLLVVSNPDDADADDKLPEDGQPSFPPFNPYPTQPSFANKPFEEMPTPPRAPAPPPLTTNLPPATLTQYPSSRPNPSNQSLSSPSSTSSRAFESTPPPSTPGQSNPPDEISSEGTLGQDGVLVGYPDSSEVTPPSASSRKGFMHKLRDFPKHKRRMSSNRPQTSPITAMPNPLPSSSSSSVNEVLMQERINLLVTKDAEHLVTVDVYGVKLRDAEYIRERIFTKLQIPDDDQHRHAFYRTEIGKYALGEALTDDQLLRLCIERGDENGTVKLLVSDSQAPLHEPSHESSQPSPTVDAIPPPVLPQNQSFVQNYAPLRPRRYSRSRRDSVSSTSERQPPEASAGYDASVSDDLDAADRESRRPTLRAPPQQQYLPRAQPLPPRPQSPTYGRPQSPTGLISPDRGATQVFHSPVSMRSDRPRASALPIPPAQLNSSDSNRFNEVLSVPGQMARSVHIRSGSDAATERERTLHGTEQDYLSYRRYRDAEEKERESPDRTRNPNAFTRDRANNQLKRAKNTMREPRYDQGWHLVPPNVQSSENGRNRPSPVQDSHLSPSRPHGLGSPYAQLQIPRPPHIPIPPTPAESRAHGKSSRLKVPQNYVIRYKDAAGRDGKDVTPQSPPRQNYPLTGAKSMGDLRSKFNAQSSAYAQPAARRAPNLPVSTSQRPGTAERSTPTAQTAEYPIPIHHEHTASSSESNVAKSYDGPRGPLASPTVPYLSLSSRPMAPTNYSVSSSSLVNHAVPSQDLYSRPHSSLGSDPAASAASPYRSTNRPMQSPNADHLSPDTPYRPLVPVTPHPSSQSYREEPSYPSVPSFGPRPQPPRSERSHAEVYALTLGSGTRGTRTPPRSPITSKPPSNESKEPEQKPAAEATGQVQRTLSSLPVHEDETPSSTESTVRRDDMTRFLDMLESNGSATIVQQIAPPASAPARPSSPSRSFDPSTFISSQSSVGTLISVNSDDSDSEAGTIWAKAPPKLPSSHSNRPVLPPIDTDSSPGSRPKPLPSRENSRVPVNFPPPPGYIPDTPPLRPPRRNTANTKKLQDQRTSRFDNNFEVTWAPRPPPEEVFERLEEYFPEHDIDEPVIDMPSGGTSPTSAEPNLPLPAEKQKFRHKKSIRLVAEEHKKRVDRRSRMEPTTSASNALRKRNTKLWDSKLEEVPTHDQAMFTQPKPASDVSPGTARPIFRWVRGELIGKGTYGKVYLALNATTGEMIAVKQVEMPRTASDRDDSRQVSVVEALKLESETLKDLDHPHIVQYLGYEETPTFLSIFLEYVPGGSIASCLRKHGKFDEEVTKSFTGQILSGLEYLHSKGILHRDMKADNILVETTGICKISDFGISKRTDDINMAGAYTSMQGTVFWMAPEVIDANKKGYNSKIDIWSVGCVVFEMWTGQRPWSGKEAMAVLLQLYQTKQGPPVPQDVILSPLADDFRQKCFAMNPDERPTAAELRKHSYLELQPDWTFIGFK